MELHCPNCTTQIQGEDVNVVKTIAKCRTCDNIFDFTRQLTAAQPPVPYRELHDEPAGVDLHEFGDSMEIEVSQRGAKGTWLLLAPVLTLLFPLVFMIGSGFPWFMWMVVFGVFLIAEIGVLWRGIGRLLNKTYIYVDRQFLSVERRPLHLLVRNDLIFDPIDVAQLYVVRKLIKERKRKKGKVTKIFGYSVALETHAGQRHVLIPDLHSADLARYLEARIETYLGIANRSMPGEFVDS